MDRVLFDREFLTKLEHLSLVARRLYRGETRGSHGSPLRGASPDFADHRDYQPGDDFRTIDWNIFARLDRLFVKLFAEEEDLGVHLLVDASGSMGFGTPPKLDYARRLAAALGYIALHSLDRVGATTFAAGLGGSLSPRRGRVQAFHLLEYLSRVTAEGGTGVGAALQDYALRTRSPGLAIVISDLLGSPGWQRGIAALRYRRFDVVLVQVLDQEEIAPAASGPSRLVDRESGATLRLTVDEPVLAAYRDRLAAFHGSVEAFCLRSGVEYLRAGTMVPFEDLVLRYLRQGAHLHARK